jgi:glutamyl-tRNA reductase
VNILAIGISHKTSSVEVREKFFLKTAERELLLSKLKNDPAVTDVLVLSTCNRTEIYAVTVYDAPAELLKYLFQIKRIPFNSGLRQYFYSYTNQRAVEHLLRVACGLDSLVLGENQILGQFKSAVELSRRNKAVSKRMNLLSHLAIEAGKKAQTETPIGCGGSSVSWAAVTAAEQNFGSLRGKSVLIVGAGKMGQLAITQLNSKGAAAIRLINRSRDKAEELGRGSGVTVASFWEISKILQEADLCICSAGAPYYLIEKDLVAQVMRWRSNKILFIDISIPRTIDPGIRLFDNVELMTIDDLDQVVGENVRRRHAAVGDVEKIIAAKMEEFYDKLARMPSEPREEIVCQMEGGIS